LKYIRLALLALAAAMATTVAARMLFGPFRLVTFSVTTTLPEADEALEKEPSV
jgi:hypothetical protein